MIAHAGITQPWKKNKVWQCKKTDPCGNMGNNGYDLFIISISQVG